MFDNGELHTTIMVTENNIFIRLFCGSFKGNTVVIFEI